MLAGRLPRFRRHRYRSAVRMNEVQPPRRLDSALARGGAEFAKNRGYVMDVIRKAGRRPRSERWSRTLRLGATQIAVAHGPRKPGPLRSAHPFAQVPWSDDIRASKPSAS